MKESSTVVMPTLIEWMHEWDIVGFIRVTHKMCQPN